MVAGMSEMAVLPAGMGSDCLCCRDEDGISLTGFSHGC